MTWIKFREIKLRAEKTGKCACGKRLKRATTFSQTINPFNTNSDGSIKTESEILKELQTEISEWKKEPPHCQEPTYWEWSDKQREQYENGETIEVKMKCGFPLKITKPTTK